EEEVELILRDLASSPWQSAVPALRRLSVLGRAEKGTLLSMLDSSDEHAAAAVEAARSLPEAARLEVATKALNHERAAVRRRAATLVGSLEDERADELARRLSTDPTPSVRIALAEAIR